MSDPAKYNLNYATKTAHGITPANLGASSWADTEAISAWQRAHGLEPDGRFGPASVAAFRASPPARPRGIDLSAHNDDTIDWPKVRASGIAFGYFKATQDTDYTSDEYKAQVAGARGVSILAGLYHYDALERSDDPVAEAEHFLRRFDQVQTDLVPALDFEELHYDGPKGPLAPAPKLLHKAEAWAMRVEARVGQWPVFYGQRAVFGYLATAMTPASPLLQCPLWLTWPNKRDPKPLRKPWGPWTVWQHDWHGTVPGIDGRVDMNVARDVAALDALRLRRTPRTAGGGLP